MLAMDWRFAMLKQYKKQLDRVEELRSELYYAEQKLCETTDAYDLHGLADGIYHLPDGANKMQRWNECLNALYQTADELRWLADSQRSNRLNRAKMENLITHICEIPYVEQ